MNQLKEIYFLTETIKQPLHRSGQHSTHRKEVKQWIETKQERK